MGRGIKHTFKVEMLVEASSQIPTRVKKEIGWLIGYAMADCPDDTHIKKVKFIKAKFHDTN